MRKITTIILMLFTLFVVGACEKIEEEVLAITGAPTSPIFVGDEVVLEANKTDVTWESENEEVATVDETGKVVGIGEGSVKIFARTTTEETYVWIVVEEEEEEPIIIQSVIRVGTNVVPSSSFFSTIWEGSQTNTEIRRLTTGYTTVVFKQDTKRYEIDPSVVKEMDIITHDDGEVTYQITLWEDLKWNDGVGITAKDYLFAMMLMTNPVFFQFVGRELTADKKIVGNTDYATTSKNLDGLAEHAGLQLMDTYTFAIRVYQEYATSYEAYLNYFVSPLPLHHLLPNSDIVAGEDGAKFTELSVTGLRNTIDFNQKGYRYDIKVTCGPYSLVAIDYQNITLTLDKNPHYKGNVDGVKPAIDRIILQYMPNQNLLPALLNGDIHLIARNYTLPLMDQLQSIEGSQEGISEQTFYRNGYSYMNIQCDEPTKATSSIAVRQTLAILSNRVEYLERIGNNRGVIPLAHYSSNQWMVQASTIDGVVHGRDQDGAFIALDSYAFDLDRAERLLEEDGWIWANEEATEEYDRLNPEHTMRYKKIEEGMYEGEVLPLIVAIGDVPQSGSLEYVFTDVLMETALLIGMKITRTYLYFDQLYHRHILGAYGDGYLKPQQDEDGNWILPEYLAIDPETELPYEEDLRELHVHLLGLGFLKGRYNPYPSVSVEFWGFDGGGNVQYIHDEWLIDTAIRMRDAMDHETYLYAWQQFQYRYNQLMPTIPLYSSQYYMFYRSELTQFNVDSDWLWTDAIVLAQLVEE